MDFIEEFENMTLEEMFGNLDNLLNGTSIILKHENVENLKEEPWRTMIIVIYCLVIACGFIENATVIGIFLTRKHLHIPTNIFIAVLAMSDILLCSYNLPLYLYQQLQDSWTYGETMCKILLPSFGFPVFMSSMAVLLIAINRYSMIVHPHRPQMSVKTAVGLITVSAILSTLILIPVSVQMRLLVIKNPVFGTDKTYCIEDWSDVKLRQIYTIVTTLMQFFLPVLATGILHAAIGLSLKWRTPRPNRDVNMKTNNILIAIVISFFVCWFPWNLFTLLFEFSYEIIPFHYLTLADSLLKIFAMISACINPFLYGWLNHNFRQHLSF